MSHPDPLQPSVADAARSDAAASAERSLPGFPEHGPLTPHSAPSPHSPIEREIERSERASAALAATRALARASFTDSQLAADDAAQAADGDIDDAGWIRTEYAALDHSVRSPQDDEPPAAPRNLVGGSFNPGIASQHGRAFPGASVPQAPIKTRTGAQARFMQEARHAPRDERAPAARPDHATAGGPPAPHERPAAAPLRAATTPARRRVAAPVRASAQSGEAFKFVLAAGFGAVVVLIGGGVAWKAGWMSHSGAASAPVITAQVAAQAEAARVLSAEPKEIAIAPAAGPAPARSSEEVDAALAAAARAAAVPVASVHAAGPSHGVHATSPAASPAVVAHATAPVAAAPAAARPAPAKAKQSVADAIAHAQSRADTFLGDDKGAAAPVTPEARPAQ